MNQIDFIKKCVPFADGFGIEKSTLTGHYMVRISESVWCMVDIIDTWEHYPIFLVRTIEGINRDIKGCEITTFKSKIFSLLKDVGGAYFYFDKNCSIDHAKQAAIEYVLDRL